MSYKIEVFPNKNYLHVRVNGKNSRETVSGYLADLRRLCVESSVPNLLIEENLEGPGLSITEIYGIITSSGRDLWPIVKKIAYVDTNPEHQAGLMRFAGKLGISFGISVYVFNAVSDAEHWIQAETA